MVRFGVIGTNWITDRFIQAAQAVQGFQLTAVYSRTAEKASEFAGKYNVSLIYTDLEAMAKSSEIDAVYIASPNSYHKEQATIFLKNGVHVLCEKPIASNTYELTEMIKTAKEHRVLLMEALKSTFLPGFLNIQNHLSKIGPVRKFISNYCQYSSRYDAYKQGKILNAFNPAFSNGSLMDIGIYCIYPAVVLFGKPKEVKASGLLLDSGVDGEGSILLKYEDKEVIITHSKITQSFLPSEIQGEKGSIVIEQISTPEKVQVSYRDGKIEDISSPLEYESMYYEAKEFIELIKQGKTESEMNSFENSLITMEIIEEARKQIGLAYPSDEKVKA
ncbi:Gfo/Idh/MocA family protein [Bacillus sp. 03113]|uniref:Gfo/Idh/MocA family protein n=1 Tax=Bacillus sp. 03113 TaxID=2578211 RepID=UPI0011432FDD|nr:Gfo/Idh/MocA family oxidoreductase [Bacillus sp. 03113]